MSTVAEALALARRVPVLPCRADKRPACPHGHLDASREPAAVRELWRRFPGPLIGVPMGARSGLDALDVDPQHAGGAWMTENAFALPVTRTHHTRSGGRHILFRHADGVVNSASRLAPGIDVRGEGGYVIWWPVEGGQIENPRLLEDWPRWLLAALLAAPVQAPPPPPSRLPASAPFRARRLVEESLSGVEAAAPGERHCKLRAASCAIGGVLHITGIPRDQAASMLLHAVVAAGGADVDQRHALKTIAWGLDRGAATPLALA